MRTLSTALTIIFSTICTFCFAQQKGNISGTIHDENMKPIESATSSLLKANDSSLIKTTVSNNLGSFQFENISNGKYLVSVSSVGRKTVFSKVVEISESNSVINLKPINLPSAIKSLAEVNVNNKRPLIEQKAGKILINVDASPTITRSIFWDVKQKRRNPRYWSYVLEH